MIFYKLTVKHTDRIQNYQEERQFFLNFFVSEVISDHGFYDHIWDHNPHIPLIAGQIYRCVLYRAGRGAVSCRDHFWSELHFFKKTETAN